MSEEHTPLEEVLDQIIMEESEPSHVVLSRWVARYPEYRDELTRFFATWAMQEASSEKVTVVDEALAGQRMVSQAMNLLYKQKVARTSDAEAEKAARLCDVLIAQGVSEEEFAPRCGLDELIVAKLDRRLIRFLSIPLRCFKKIAAALGRSIEEVRAMLAGAPIPLRTYKARERPEVKTEDFVDAVRSSSLSADAKTEWIEAVANGNDIRGAK
jgi:hypothetical protein